MRPMYLRRIEFTESRLPYEDDTAPDASRTFGPAPATRGERVFVVVALLASAAAVVTGIWNLVAGVVS
jgi:hypothetical protein